MNYLRRPITSIVLYFPLIVCAQEFDWVYTNQGTSQTTSTSIALDADGYVYTVGTFSYRSVFGNVYGPGKRDFVVLEPYGSSSRDTFIQKLDPAGNLEWVNQIGNCKPRAISFDSENNMYLTGTFYDSVDFNPMLSEQFYLSSTKGRRRNADIFILKLTSDARFIWAKKIGSQGADLEPVMAIDHNNHVILAGRRGGKLAYDDQPASDEINEPLDDDFFICKIDSDGNIIWLNEYSGKRRDLIHAITVDLDGNIYATGFFSSNLDFNPGGQPKTLISTKGEKGYYSHDIFIIKLSEDGGLVWVKQFGGLESDSGQSITTDQENNIYVAGSYGKTVDFDAGKKEYYLTSKDQYDGFVQKMNPDGELIWATSMGGNNWDEYNGIHVDRQANVYATGYISGRATFETGQGEIELVTAGKKDAFIQKMNPNGSTAWVKRIGSTGNDEGVAIVSDADGNSYTHGFFNDKVDFDPGEGSFELVVGEITSGYDCFILKLKE